jgi:hypothetical protein
MDHHKSGATRLKKTQ